MGYRAGANRDRVCSGVGAGVATTSGGIEVVRVTIRYGVYGSIYKIKIVAQCDCALLCCATCDVQSVSQSVYYIPISI